MQLITILGQTSSGKSDMAIELCEYIRSIGKKACIVGCDSRQIYKGLNIGTGKVEGKWVYDQTLNRDIFKYKYVAHFMIDFVDPKLDYNLQNYISDFYDLMLAIEDYFDFVILVGGTGFYANAITQKLNLGSVKPEFLSQYEDYKSNLQGKPIHTLQDSTDNLLVKLNNSDYNNKIRLVSNLLKAHCQDNNWLDDSIYYEFEKQYTFAISIVQNVLKNKIETRLKQRFDQGLIAEVKEFEYLGQNKFILLGLEYRQAWFYNKGDINLEELKQNLLIENLQYAKRQLTWLKQQKNLIWIRNLDEMLEQLKIQSTF